MACPTGCGLAIKIIHIILGAIILALSIFRLIKIRDLNFLGGVITIYFM